MVGRVMSPEQAVEVTYDVLFIDDVCSFLNQRLVFDLRRDGKAIVGVFSPDDGSDGKRRLLDVGIGDVVESDARPEEFLAIARTASSHSLDPVVAEGELPVGGLTLGVTGPPGGVGVTEIAIAIANELARRTRVALVDLNQSWPSVGQRLGLNVHPNLRTAVDFALHDPGRLHQAMHGVGNVHVVTGLANPEVGTLPPSDIAGLVSAISAVFSLSIVDMGPVSQNQGDVVLRRLDVALVVGTGDPVGLTRLVRAYERFSQSVPEVDIALVVNQVTGSSHQRAEVANQLSELLPAVPRVVVPRDDRLARASWNGELVERGPFMRQVRRLAELFESVPR